MSLVVSFAQVLRLWRNRCQPKHSSSATSPRTIAAGLTNLAFMLCPHNGLLPSRVGEANTKSSSLLYSVCWRKSLRVVARAFAHWDGIFAGFGLGTVENLPTSENLLDGNSVCVPEGRSALIWSLERWLPRRTRSLASVQNPTLSEKCPSRIGHNRQAAE